MREHELPVCFGPGRLPDEIVANGQPVTDYTLPAGEAADLTWRVPIQKLFVQNNTGADVLVLVGAAGCTAGNRTARLEDGQTLILGQSRPHLVVVVSIRPEVEAVIHSDEGAKTLTVLGWTGRGY